LRSEDSAVAIFAGTPIEKVRKYWDARPCNIRHSPSPVGTREYFDEVEARRYFVEPHIPGFAEFERWRGRKVLEIGCGIGTDTMNFARAGAQITAVDLSANSLAVAQRRAQLYGLSERIRFYEANAEALSEVVPPEPYDLVYSFGVIHHTPSPERAIREISRHYVRPGSTLKLMLYHRYSWKVFWILTTFGKGAFWKLDELIARHSEAETGCPVTYSYSRRSAQRLLGGQFRITQMAVRHIFPYRIPDYVQYRYVKVWYFRYLPSPLFRGLEQRIGWHLCITAVAR
jgi:2-polyprenyl-3-methyl-5-hydroxy-6-metoxy-1,4-benzoquinol methylase